MNEELQSTNEELETINDELNQRSLELNQTNLFLESILRSLDGGVVVLDGEMRVNAWNQGAEELWGLRGEEVQGEHFLILDIGLPLHELRPALRAALSGVDHQEPLELAATNRRGRQIKCRVRLSPLLPDGGPPVGLIVFMEPID
jgi:two-component system CheB/CheR fusion protein